jgi:hypothetical protein
MSLVFLKTKNDVDIIGEMIESSSDKMTIKNPVSFFNLSTGMIGMKYLLIYSDNDSIELDKSDFLFVTDNVKSDISIYYSDFVTKYLESDSGVLTDISEDIDDSFIESESMSKMIH